MIDTVINTRRGAALPIGALFIPLLAACKCLIPLIHCSSVADFRPGVPEYCKMDYQPQQPFQDNSADGQRVVVGHTAWVLPREKREISCRAE